MNNVFLNLMPIKENKIEEFIDTNIHVLNFNKIRELLLKIKD